MHEQHISSGRLAVPIHLCAQAVASLDGSAVAPDGRQMSLKAIPEVTQDEENDADSDVPESGFVELAMEAADAFEKLDDCRLTRMAKVATRCAHHGHSFAPFFLTGAVAAWLCLRPSANHMAMDSHSIP